MNLKLLICVWFVFYSLFSYSQNINVETTETAPFSDSDKFYFGGNIQLYISNQYSVYGLSPLIGYKLSETSSLGFSPFYEHASFDSNNSVNSYGYRLLGKQIFAEYGILQAEWESMIFKYKNASASNRLQRFLVGGGYREYIGGDIYLETILLWDVTHGSKSYARVPLVLRGGITIGL